MSAVRVKREACYVPIRRTDENFSVALPHALEERGVSGRELARKIGINQSYLSLVVSGRRAPSRRLMVAAAKALGLPPDYFREEREAIVLERIKADARALEQVYELVRKKRGKGR